MLDVSETKKRLRDFVNRLSADFGDYNHLGQFNRKMDEAEKILEYIEAKIIIRNERAHEAATIGGTKKEKKYGNDAATDGADAKADSGRDAGSSKAGKSTESDV